MYVIFFVAAKTHIFYFKKDRRTGKQVFQHDEQNLVVIVGDRDKPIEFHRSVYSNSSIEIEIGTGIGIGIGIEREMCERHIQIIFYVLRIMYVHM